MNTKELIEKAEKCTTVEEADVIWAELGLATTIWKHDKEGRTKHGLDCADLETQASEMGQVIRVMWSRGMCGRPTAKGVLASLESVIVERARQVMSDREVRETMIDYIGDTMGPQKSN